MADLLAKLASTKKSDLNKILMQETLEVTSIED